MVKFRLRFHFIIIGSKAVGGVASSDSAQGSFWVLGETKWSFITKVADVHFSLSLTAQNFFDLKNKSTVGIIFIYNQNGIV